MYMYKVVACAEHFCAIAPTCAVHKYTVYYYSNILLIIMIIMIVSLSLSIYIYIYMYTDT